MCVPAGKEGDNVRLFLRKQGGQYYARTDRRTETPAGADRGRPSLSLSRKKKKKTGPNRKAGTPWALGDGGGRKGDGGTARSAAKKSRSLMAEEGKITRSTKESGKGFAH